MGAYYPLDIDGIQYDCFHLKVIFERDGIGFEESKELNTPPNSIVVGRYQVIEYLGSAAFSKAMRCYDLKENRTICMKIIKNDKDFLDQSLDEIKILRLINTNANQAFA